jgi:hypothetical protein
MYEYIKIQHRTDITTNKLYSYKTSSNVNRIFELMQISVPIVFFIGNQDQIRIL